MRPIATLLAAAGCAAALTPTFAAGDAEAGRVLYQARCAVCHSLDYNGVGPAHRGVFGRAAAQAKGFAYSDALKSQCEVHRPDRLLLDVTTEGSIPVITRVGVIMRPVLAQLSSC